MTLSQPKNKGIRFLYRFGLALLSGILLWLSWPPHGLAFLSFLAFVPLLMVSQSLADEDARLPFLKGMGYSYLTFVVWNILTTWWVKNSTLEGCIAMVVLNSLFMSMVFGGWQRFRKLRLPFWVDALCFTSFWCAWEFLHLNWDLSWPWLNLGNLFSACTEFVQWYEITGAFGGTIWILVANFLIVILLQSVRQTGKRRIIVGSVLLGWLIGPAAISLIRFYTYPMPTEQNRRSIEAVVVQQNTDPWEEEYAMSNKEHAARILEVARPLITDNTAVVVCPESALANTMKYDNFMRGTARNSEIYGGMDLFDTTILTHPELNFIFGTSIVLYYDHKATETAHLAPGIGQLYYDYCNTSVCYNRFGVTGTYFKSKLVPGVEKMPYPQIFGFLEEMAIDLGGTSGSLGADSEQRAFLLPDYQVRIGVPVCYESAYGEHFGEFVRNGAQVMAVITNDAWWGETPGHTQHFLLSKLRAVETRRSIMRAANTGTSAFIDERGTAHQTTKYGVRTAIRQNVFLNDQQTFYTRHGDYLARFFTFIAGAMLLFGITLGIGRKVRRRKAAQQNVTSAS